MNEKKKYYISTAIAYTSGRPHIGNTYEIVLADAIARFKRASGYDVYFQTGTDEHGLKIQQKAAEMGITPQQFTDNVSALIKENWDLMNTSYDRFIRTTDEQHCRQVQKIFKYLYDKGDIYKSTYEGMYCIPCESFFTPSQLVDGKCPDCGREVKPAKEEAYFFKLSKYQDRLMKHIEENPHFIQPESRRNEMVNNFLKPGLQDLCVSRTTFDWGVQVDFDPKHVVYVWIDALSNYITFPGYDVDGNHGETYKKYWPADVHLIGKDILRFHTIYWPIILMALDLPLPKQVFGHPWVLMADGKMSKSKGNIIYADDLVHFFGVDAVRYYLLHEMPFAADGVINYELFIEKINTNLANILGNLVKRTVSMAHQYNAGVLRNSRCNEPVDDELISLCKETPVKVAELMDTNHVADAISEIFTLLRRANKYIDETTPWILGKDPEKKDRLDTVLYNLAEVIRVSGALLRPFLPETGDRIFEQLNLQPQELEDLVSFGGIADGHVLGEPAALFARIDPKKCMAEVEKYLAEKYPAPKAEPKAEEKKEDKKKEKKAEKKEELPEGIISIEDFAKVSLTCGKILACEKVEKSDKLLKIQLNMGDHERQVVSGIAQWYTADDLIGKTVIVVSNLKPAKLRGVESNGMILAADSGDGVKVIFTDAEPGSKVR